MTLTDLCKSAEISGDLTDLEEHFRKLQRQYMQKVSQRDILSGARILDFWQNARSLGTVDPRHTPVFILKFCALYPCMGLPVTRELSLAGGGCRGLYALRLLRITVLYEHEHSSARCSLKNERATYPGSYT